MTFVALRVHTSGRNPPDALANPATAPQARAPKKAPAAGRARSIVVSSAYIGHDTARQVRTSLGASLTPLAQTRRSSLA